LRWYRTATARTPQRSVQPAFTANTQGHCALTLCSKSCSHLHKFTWNPDKATRHHRLDKPGLAEHNALLPALFTIHLDHMNVVHSSQAKLRIQRAHARQLGPTSLASRHDTMPVSNQTSAGSGPSTYSLPQAGSGLATQACNSAPSRRSSFDVIVDAAKTQAAYPQASSSTGNESGPYWSDRSSLTSRGRNKQAVDIENQAETFEDIELQDWPTASHPAVMNTDTTALAAQTPPVSTRQPRQPPLSSDAMRRALAASPPKSSDLNEETGLWSDLVAMMGAMLTGKITIDE
jgi:hypothetical protein